MTERGEEPSVDQWRPRRRSKKFASSMLNLRKRSSITVEQAKSLTVSPERTLSGPGSPFSPSPFEPELPPRPSMPPLDKVRQNGNSYVECACSLIPKIEFHKTSLSSYEDESLASETRDRENSLLNDLMDDCVSDTYNLFMDHKGNLWTRAFNNCNAAFGVSCCREKFGVCIPKDHDSLLYNGSIASFKYTHSQEDECEEVVEENNSNKYLKERSKFKVGPSGYRVLSLDGGGIRGLIMAQILIVIEEIAGCPIRDLYDWIIGTSTGALMALQLANGKCCRYCRSMYFGFKDSVFNGKRPYDSTNFENLMRQEFGENTKMTELSFLKIAVTTLLADRFPPILHLFRNYQNPEEVLSRLLEKNQGQLRLFDSFLLSEDGQHGIKSKPCTVTASEDSWKVGYCYFAVIR
ncbi:85/88 kDa calcium-independent phospholipase A2 [Cichlidogyrus casuarinus]|uniref:85/88 kDa calcium-independent phospholipase A2 n=1 Tax=Cichlidogyrus casuarinus TaxID=1844966 RepID=A0ABD2PYN4_9PLAT